MAKNDNFKLEDISGKSLKQRLFPYLCIAPSMFFMCLYTLYPCIYLFFLSFQNWNLLADMKWVGIENYVSILSDAKFIAAFWNTLYYTAVRLPIMLLLSTLLACWFKGTSRINSLSRAAIFLPHLISFVTVSFIFQMFMNPHYGVFNFVLKTIGLPTSRWLQDGATAMNCIIFITLWKSLGYDMLLILSAMSQISPEYYEAASLDNAKKMSVFTKITLPLISPQLFSLSITSAIGSFKVYDAVNMLTGGGPGTATQVLVILVRQWFSNQRLGYSAAAGMILLLIVLLITAFQTIVVSKRVHYQ